MDIEPKQKHQVVSLFAERPRRKPTGTELQSLRAERKRQRNNKKKGR